jgi:hypothetical protein
MYFIPLESMLLTFSFDHHCAESGNISKQKDYNPFSRVEPKEIPHTPNCKLTLCDDFVPS